MDYSLAAVKLFAAQLKNARPVPPTVAAPSNPTVGPSMTLGTLLFQRAWLQGVLVAGTGQGCFILDDGSSIIELFLSKEFQQQQWKTGMYVMVIGAYTISGAGSPVIKVHKIVDLSMFPDREAMWHLEVSEAFQMFYEVSMQESAF